MDSNKNEEGTYGGKTIGSVGGGLYVYLCSCIPEGNPLKHFAVYAAPFIAVWGDQIGGVVAYEIKATFRAKYQHVKLDRLKRRIDNLPDVPESAMVKKEITEKYFKVHSEILFKSLEDIQRLNELGDAEFSSKKNVEK